MWVKAADNNYVNLETGAVVRAASDSVVLDVVARTFYPNGAVLRNGFATKDDAQAALDEFMIEQGFEQIQPPVAEEEK